MDQGGTQYMKWKEIEREVFSEFIRCKEKFLPVHDRDLIEFALTSAEKFGVDNFKVFENAEIIITKYKV